jgi:hypothetical protein
MEPPLGVVRAIYGSCPPRVLYASVLGENALIAGIRRLVELGNMRV